MGIGTDADLVTAALAAVDRLEKQVLKVRAKLARYQAARQGSRRREGQRERAPVTAKSAKKAGQGACVRSATAKARKKVFRVNHRDGSKPMTLEEAMLEMEASQDYMVYRDAQTDRVTVLMRRPDGHFDLIES